MRQVGYGVFGLVLLTMGLVACGAVAAGCIDFDAIADERSRSNQPTERLMWLSRADRPDIRRPDQDMEPFIKGAAVSEVSGDTYIARLRVRPDGWVISATDDASQNSSP